MADIDDEIAELRVRLAKLEDQRAREKAAAAPLPSTPVVGAPEATTAKSNRGWVIMLLVVGAFVIFLVAAANTGSKKAEQDQITQGAAASASTAPLAPAAPSPPATPPIPTYAWVYSSDVDEMSDRKTLTACVDSSDRVSLDWPYHPVTAELCVRNSPKFGVDVYYRLNGDGQIMCTSYDGCTAKVRYGDAPAGRNGAMGSADNSSNIVFLNGPRAVVARLARAKTTKIELTFYQAGTQSVTFPTEGLDLRKVNLGGAKKGKAAGS